MNEKESKTFSDVIVELRKEQNLAQQGYSAQTSDY